MSDTQLESVIYAGEAHSGHLAGAWTVDETWDLVSAAAEENDAALRFRRGWFLGDGTGAGKGRPAGRRHHPRQLAQGRRRSLWVSVSDRRLLEDAQRDWSALGAGTTAGDTLVALPSGLAHIKLAEGILFTTSYATLRSQERGRQGEPGPTDRRMAARDFDGVIITDEAHAMANAAGGKGARGDVSASQQGRAGLRLQHACPMPASSMSRPPAPRLCRTSPMPSDSGCGAAKTSLSLHAPIS